MYNYICVIRCSDVPVLPTVPIPLRSCQGMAVVARHEEGGCVPVPLPRGIWQEGSLVTRRHSMATPDLQSSCPKTVSINGWQRRVTWHTLGGARVT